MGERGCMYKGYTTQDGFSGHVFRLFVDVFCCCFLCVFFALLLLCVGSSTRRGGYFSSF